MAIVKVIRPFKDKDTRKVYAVGDSYNSDDPERISLLEEKGFLASKTMAEESVSNNLPTIEAFAELKADAQKALLSKLKIDGDASNEEKRAALYAAFLQSRSGDE